VRLILHVALFVVVVLRGGEPASHARAFGEACAVKKVGCGDLSEEDEGPRVEESSQNKSVVEEAELLVLYANCLDSVIDQPAGQHGQGGEMKIGPIRDENLIFWPLAISRAVPRTGKILVGKKFKDRFFIGKKSGWCWK